MTSRSPSVETAFRLGSGAGFLAWKSALALGYAILTYLMFADVTDTGNIDSSTTYNTSATGFQTDYHYDYRFLGVNTNKRHDPMRYNHYKVNAPTTPASTTTLPTAKRRRALCNPTPTTDLCYELIVPWRGAVSRCCPAVVLRSSHSCPLVVPWLSLLLCNYPAVSPRLSRGCAAPWSRCCSAAVPLSDVQ